MQFKKEIIYKEIFGIKIPWVIREEYKGWKTEIKIILTLLICSSVGYGLGTLFAYLIFKR
jgi:hypothetical protein